MSDPQAFTAQQAADPATPAQTLADIAAQRPDLRAALASNPSTYQALLDWLGELGDPDVDAALAARGGGSPAAPVQSATPQQPEPVDQGGPSRRRGRTSPGRAGSPPPTRSPGRSSPIRPHPAGSPHRPSRGSPRPVVNRRPHSPGSPRPAISRSPPSRGSRSRAVSPGLRSRGSRAPASRSPASGSRPVARLPGSSGRGTAPRRRRRATPH